MDKKVIIAVEDIVHRILHSPNMSSNSPSETITEQVLRFLQDNGNLVMTPELNSPKHIATIEELEMAYMDGVINTKKYLVDNQKILNGKEYLKSIGK